MCARISQTESLEYPLRPIRCRYLRKFQYLVAEFTVHAAELFKRLLCFREILFPFEVGYVDLFPRWRENYDWRTIAERWRGLYEKLRHGSNGDVAAHTAPVSV